MKSPSTAPSTGPSVEPPMELLSTRGCPYGLAGLAALCAAGASFTFTEVSPRAIPDWVARATPKGEVPVLRVGARVIFESSAIGEYVNELAGGALLPTDPLARAWVRAWSLYVPALNPHLFRAGGAANREAFDDHLGQLEVALAPLERALGDAPEAAVRLGGAVGLFECTYFAFFARLLALEAALGRPVVAALRLRAWGRAAVEVIAPRHPALAGHGDHYVSHFAGAGGYLAEALAAATGAG